MNRIHIISQGNKWAVRKSKSKRALKLFNHRDEAYFYARSISNDIIVHNKDAEVVFTYHKKNETHF